MFHATLDSTGIWKQIVDALATLLTEVHFVASKTGMALRQLDSSKAAMIDLTLPSGVFQDYKCDGEYNICLGIDELAKVSKRMASDDTLEFVLAEGDNRFEINMTGRADRQFKLQLLTPPESVTKKPSIDLDVKAEMFTDAFKQAVKDIGVVSSYVKILAEKDSVMFRGEGDTGEAQVLLKTGEESSLFDLAAKKDSSSMYALNYLAEITKALSGDTVTLQFSTNKPLIMEAAIAEGGKIIFVLAPRVERR